MDSKFDLLGMDAESIVFIKHILDHFPAVLALYHQALINDPNNPEIWYNIGVLFFFKGDYEMALLTMEHSLALDSEYFRARSILGLIAFDQKQWNKAIDI
jgi:tetratricopeptide (TPR) repeat protein